MLRDSKKRFGKQPVLIAHFGWEEILEAYLAQKNKLLPLKRSEQMGLQNVRGFTQRSTGILTVLLSKIGFWLRISLQAHFAQLVDNQLVLKSQLAGWKSQLRGRKSQL